MKTCRDILPAAVPVACKLSQANLQSKYRLVSITRWGGAGVNVTYLDALEAGVLRNCARYFTWGSESSSCRSRMDPYNPIPHLQSCLLQLRQLIPHYPNWPQGPQHGKLRNRVTPAVSANAAAHSLHCSCPLRCSQ